MDYGYIYYVRNEINGMMYIGKITTQTLYHKKTSYKGSGVVLAEALKEYGTKNFSIHYIASAASSEELTFLEKYYLIYYKIPNEKFYNVNLATNSSGQSDYFNKNNLKGTNTRNIICYDIKNNIQTVFNNMTQFCKEKDFGRGNIFNVLSGQRITHKDCVFWYENHPLSQDAINWILNYKNKTNYKTKYFNIKQVKEEMNTCYKIENNKISDFTFNGYYIEDNKEIEIDWEEIDREYQTTIERDGKMPQEPKIIGELNINTEKDNKFELERDVEYILFNDNIKLYLNYDEINNLTKIYSDINPRLLRQAINRRQKTVMNKKYLLTILRAHNKRLLCEMH